MNENSIGKKRENIAKHVISEENPQKSKKKEKTFFLIKKGRVKTSLQKIYYQCSKIISTDSFTSNRLKKIEGRQLDSIEVVWVRKKKSIIIYIPQYQVSVKYT